MLFNSYTFLFFVFVAFSAYYLPILSKYQVMILIISSLIFYAYSQPYLVLLLIASAAINIITVYFVMSKKGNSKKIAAVLGVSLNLFMLAFFKYGPLFSKTFLDVSSSIGQFLLSIPLPLGISFFTFQGISLVVDIFREKNNKENEHDLLRGSFPGYARHIILFISFFPKQIAGPIVKSYDFLPQIDIKKISDIDWEACFKCLVLGYFLKMVIADNLKDFTFWISYPYFQGFSSITLLFMLYGYSCQIFADFAGYSLIAIGLAKLFGYNLQQNFYFPYIATSFSEFWQRWHISLSTFLKEYLYIPLGGNRKGRIRTYVNLMITMSLGGLWHGAAWSYALWGFLHGLALTLERMVSQGISMERKPWFIKIIKGMFVFCFVTICWALFRLPNIDHFIGFIKSIFTNLNMYHERKIITLIFLYSIPVIAYHAVYLFKERLRHYLQDYGYLAYGVMLFMLVVNSGSSSSFIYFQF